MPSSHRMQGPPERWRYRACVGAVIAALLLTSKASAEPRAPSAELELFWHDTSNALAFPHRFIGRFVSEAFAPLGVSVRWSGAASDLVTSGNALRIVLLPQDRSSQTRERGVIGAVHRDAKARTVWVMLPNVKRVLGLADSSGTTSAETMQLARALARIVVHEVFHLVVPQHPHTAGSLMQARFGRQDLLAPIRLAPELGTMLLTALRDERPTTGLGARAAVARPARESVPALP